MLRAVSLALSSLMIAQSPDDILLCTTASDCPSGAACEDGVCVAREVAPAEPPRRERRQRRRRVRDPYRCRRGDCQDGEECFRGACGPPVPSTGNGLLIAGAVVSGVGLIFFGSSAICQADDRADVDQNTCTAIQASIGAVALAAGVPMLVIGVIRRLRFQEWVRTYHPQFALLPAEGGARATLGFSF
jgi:hypothetical protein